MTETVCPGCGLAGPAEEGPTHAYMLASPQCWRLFNDLMAREYETPELMPTHYLSVDAYAVQHPGDPHERRARQSVWIHLAGLEAVLRQGREPAFRYKLLRRLVDEVASFPPPPPHAPFEVLTADVSRPMGIAEHQQAMREWAEAALAAYEDVTPDLARQLAALA